MQMIAATLSLHDPSGLCDQAFLCAQSEIIRSHGLVGLNQLLLAGSSGGRVAACALVGQTFASFRALAFNPARLGFRHRQHQTVQGHVFLLEACLRSGHAIGTM